MSWTPVAKPTSRNYTNVNPAGKTQYDQSDITYDDPNMYYDGVNPSQWTEVAKPLAGYDIAWSQMSMAWNEALGSWGSENPWINVNKPT